MRRCVSWIVSLMVVGLAATVAEPTLITDKKEYDQGETIVFVLRNESDEAMMWGSISDYPTVWRRLEDGTEEVVRESPSIVLLALGYLEPGGVARWEWDQKDYYQWYDKVMWIRDPRTQVDPGTYVGKFETLTHGTFQTEPFIILPPTRTIPKGPLATTWGALKAGR